MPLCEKHGHMVGEGSRCAVCEQEMYDLEQDTQEDEQGEPGETGEPRKHSKKR